jgi:predicted small metal-binding protein
MARGSGTACCIGAHFAFLCTPHNLAVLPPRPSAAAAASAARLRLRNGRFHESIFGVEWTPLKDSWLGSQPEEANMAKVINCRDVGIDCDFQARGETEDDVMQQCAEHARNEHGMNEIPPELASKVRAAMRDE